MKTPHLLRVEQGAAEYAPLFEAARALDLRIGWLELGEPAPGPVPSSLEAAAGEGALRAVAVGGGRTVVLKPMKGAPVLRDLLREHFRGCALVLVLGECGDVPRLSREGEGYRVASGAVVRAFDAAHFAEALRRPRPFEAESVENPATAASGEAAPAAVP
ncbi:MAG TPA: hypothetical protein VN851_02190 [Thermoanaerobaculia bacterium]|nr:hypothetical protein [Thermoanaerobaculia bacterium]